MENTVKPLFEENTECCDIFKDFLTRIKKFDVKNVFQNKENVIAYIKKDNEVKEVWIPIDKIPVLCIGLALIGGEKLPE